MGQTAALMTQKLFPPFIETLLRGLPHAYCAVPAAVGTRVQVVISTEIGGSWEMLRAATGWQLQPPGPAAPTVSVTPDPDTAWKLFTKGLSAAQARPRAQVVGEETLALAALQLVAVMG